MEKKISIVNEYRVYIEIYICIYVWRDREDIVLSVLRVGA